MHLLANIKLFYPALCFTCVFGKKLIKKFWFNNAAKNTAHQNYAYSDFFNFLIRFLSLPKPDKIKFIAGAQVSKKKKIPEVTSKF